MDDNEIDELGPPLVLLADDDYDIACELAECLHAHGCRVFIEAAGNHAVAVAEEHHPDILILDIEMPGLNGYEVARYIRSQPWGQKPILIAHTGLVEDSDKQDAFNAGFDHHIGKPFSVEIIATLIRSCGYTFELKDPKKYLRF